MRRPGDGEHMEAHLMDEHTGHESSTDCWCEPKYYWSVDQDDMPLLVIEHDDTQTDIPHVAVLFKRNEERDWVTVLLDAC